MVITTKKADPIIKELRQIKADGRSRIGLVDLTNIFRRYGVLEGTHRKELTIYMELNGFIKVENGLVILCNLLEGLD